MLQVAQYLQILSVVCSFIGLIIHFMDIKKQDKKLQLLAKLFMVLALILLVIVYIISYLQWKKYSKTKTEISLNIVQTGLCFIPVGILEIIFILS
jgi:hypothetical protein|tara:strand:- start:3067 stop:3351 length:285 start_codon:yes stop_codon:yes gene_type:complete